MRGATFLKDLSMKFIRFFRTQNYSARCSCGLKYFFMRRCFKFLSGNLTTLCSALFCSCLKGSSTPWFLRPVELVESHDQTVPSPWGPFRDLASPNKVPIPYPLGYAYFFGRVALAYLYGGQWLSTCTLLGWDSGSQKGYAYPFGVVRPRCSKGCSKFFKCPSNAISTSIHVKVQ